MAGRRVVAWVVAAAVTVALVAGGVLVAKGGRGRSPAVLPALDLGDAGQATASDSAGAIEPAPAPGTEPAPGTTEPVRRSGDLPFLRPKVTYRLRGALPDLPDQARAWKVGDSADAARVAALAAALGLAGQPKEGPDGWTVQDGRRVLRVQRLAGVPWTYGTGVLGSCTARAGGIQCLDPDTPVSNQPAPRPVTPAKPLPRPARPSRAEAERVARDLAARAGLDLAGASVRVADAYATRLVTVDPAVGGAVTSGFALTVSVGAKGAVGYAGGYLATPTAADTYPLIGVEAGFERLKKASPLGPLGKAEAPAVEREPCPAVSKAGIPCTVGPLRARVATVTGVRLGLQLAPALAEGDRAAKVAYLLPAYRFDLEGGWTDVRAIVAVPDRYLTSP